MQELQECSRPSNARFDVPVLPKTRASDKTSWTLHYEMMAFWSKWS